MLSNLATESDRAKRLPMARSSVTQEQNTTPLNKASTPANGVGKTGWQSERATEVGGAYTERGTALEAGSPFSIPLGEAYEDVLWGGGGGGSPSLDRDVSSSNNAYRPSWDRQQKRGYHRIQSCFQYWQARGYQVLWLMLSTSGDGDGRKLAYHHQMLKQRVERKLGYDGIQHWQVRTAEGNGVLHLFWAWRARDGFRQRSFYVKQAWLSRQWQEIHGAKIVWIERVRGGRVSRNKVSRYCMSQYVGKQSAYQYMSWSWKRTFGVPLVGCWRAFKGLWSRRNGNRSRKGLYALWGAFLAGELIPLGNGWYTRLEVVRLGYQEYGSALWASMVSEVSRWSKSALIVEG